MRLAVTAATALLSSLLWVTPALAQGFGERGPSWHPGWGWDHMLFGGLMMIAFWGAIIVLLVLLVRWLGGASGPNHPSSASASRRSPLEILQERFAKGEIDKEDYEERRKLLSD